MFLIVLWKAAAKPQSGQQLLLFFIIYFIVIFYTELLPEPEESNWAGLVHLCLIKVLFCCTLLLYYVTTNALDFDINRYYTPNFKINLQFVLLTGMITECNWSLQWVLKSSRILGLVWKHEAKQSLAKLMPLLEQFTKIHGNKAWGSAVAKW